MFSPIASIASGAVTKDFLFEVAKGNVAGHSLFNIASVNFDISTGSAQDLWVPGGTMDYPTANEAWEIVSTSPNDTGAGTGAQKVDVTYQNSSGVVIGPIELTMNGNTSVPLPTANGYRPQRLVVTAVGSTGFNEGVITLQRVSDQLPRDGISIGDNASGNSHRTIPAGKFGFLFLVSGFTGKNKDVIIRYLATEGQNGIFETLFGFGLYQNSFVAPLLIPSGPLPSRSDVKVTVETENNKTTATITFQLLLVDSELVNVGN